jgi:CBS-domain-containing membrane protein
MTRTVMSVADVMQHRCVAVRETARFSEIVAAMRRFHVSSLPVVDAEHRVIGMVSNYDLLFDDCRSRQGEAATGEGGRLRRFVHGRRYGDCGRLAVELMTTPAVTVTPGTSVREAAREMFRHHIHQLPVVDPMPGRLIGIVTRSDLLAVYERPDELIRREILYDVIEGTLALPRTEFGVTVAGGVVTIRGRLGLRSDALRLVGAITHVEGVISVVDRLTYERDDTTDRAPL